MLKDALTTLEKGADGKKQEKAQEEVIRKQDKEDLEEKAGEGSSRCGQTRSGLYRNFPRTPDAAKFHQFGGQSKSVTHPARRLADRVLPPDNRRPPVIVSCSLGVYRSYQS